jgi:hypothetical protein
MQLIEQKHAIDGFLYSQRVKSNLGLTRFLCNYIHYVDPFHFILVQTTLIVILNTVVLMHVTFLLYTLCLAILHA